MDIEKLRRNFGFFAFDAADPELGYPTLTYEGPLEVAGYPIKVEMDDGTTWYGIADYDGKALLTRSDLLQSN